MRALGIFARAPIPGRVKARLTEDVGPSTAAEVYWQVGRRVVTNVAGSGYRTIIWFTPPTEGAFMREWLDDVGRVELRPQGGGNRDIVLGPTAAGRVYLIRLREPQPELFRGVHWSSAAVLAHLKARAADGRLAPHLLRPLREVATLQDARALGLLSGRSNIDGT